MDLSTGDPRMLSSESLAVWTAQADGAGALPPPSPLEPPLLSLTCGALGASPAWDVPGELTEWRSS